MKRILTVLSAAVSILSGCSKMAETSSAPGSFSGEITVSFDDGTKAGYTGSETYETEMSSVELLVFMKGSSDETSYLDVYHECTSAEISGKSAKIRTKAPAKLIYAVVNGPRDGSVLKASKVATVAGLKAIAVDLSQNSTTSGFFAIGSADVAENAATASISVKRLAARVALRSIKNNLPAAYSEAVTFNGAFIANVVGNQNFGGDAAASTWYNKMGRADGTQSHIIDGSTYAAACPALTWASGGETIARGSTLNWSSKPKLFYAYPNSSTVKPSGWAASFSAQKSTLVVAMTIKGVKYYYVIVLPDGTDGNGTIAANTAYTVDLTVNGLGSTDPDKPVTKVDVTASFTIADWATGAEYGEQI